MNVRENNPKHPTYARKAAAKATPNSDAMEETAKAEAPLEAPVAWGPLPLLVELPLPLGWGEPEGAEELEEEGTPVAAA
jgi:hypothetical protein